MALHLLQFNSDAMYTLNPLASKPAVNHPQLSRRRQSYTTRMPSRHVRTTASPSYFYHSAVRASAQNPSPRRPNNSQNIVKNSEVPNSISLKTTLITTISAAVAIFLSSFYFPSRPAAAAAAAPISPSPAAVETTAKDSISNEENEKPTEECPHSDSDIKELKDSFELQLKSRNFPEAARILDKLTELEPDEIEWRLLRADLYGHSGELQLAREIFHDVLNKNPICLEACQGLVNADSLEESTLELKKTQERILEAIRLSMETRESTNLRDFKLLLAQIRVLEGKYDEALEFYKELEKEEPDDYRIYLCQGLVYSLLSRKSEAEVNFEKYRKLVPEGHIYDRYFGDDSLSAIQSSTPE